MVAIGRDFRPATLLTAYRAGIFPWPHSREMVPWCCPDPRAIKPIDGELHWSRSLRRTLRRGAFRVTVDACFERVMRTCGELREEGTWITEEMIGGYVALHRLGWARSLEVWEGDALVGGIYGLMIGGLFAGESMFHTRTDASKVAFASLSERLRDGGATLFDVQVMTDHLASLGCVEISRAEYLRRLSHAITRDARLGP